MRRVEDLRKYLKPVRKALKLKQQEFAKLLGVSNVTLSYWEHGRLGMGLKNQKQKTLRLLNEMILNQ